MTNDKEKSDFIGRLKATIDKCGDQKKVFAKRCGISETNLYTYLKGASEPGMRFFYTMKEQYPWVDIDWLITGVEQAAPKAADQGGGGSVDFQHEEIIKGFSDKPAAKDINIDLLDIERLSKTAFKETGAHIKTVANTLRAAAKDLLGENGPAVTEDKKAG